jgi:hypothetical protein
MEHVDDALSAARFAAGYRLRVFETLVRPSF